MNDSYWTTADIAAHFQVTVKTVNNWYHKGLFPNAIRGPKTGRGYTHLIPEQDVTNFVPPPVGRRPDVRPTAAARAQRRSRARRADQARES